MQFTPFVHPDRKGEGPFLWAGIPLQANMLVQGVRYWALSGELPHSRFNRLEQYLEEPNKLRLRIVPTKRKDLSSVMQEKKASGYQAWT